MNNEPIRECDRIRAALGPSDAVRFEPHIAETYKSIVGQPYPDKHDAVNRTAAALVRAGIPVLAAPLLHGKAG